ncbi:hypothetical protein PTTG_04034 [Puccinia triticina 1-1 BBBD Race 1]|uniref:Charged multivesicular body protein 7 n=2 Tax=Puccinia triticina TaxID=208348 RepID=A0A180GV29_PUCT1|nr:uncharacterized protein PtA15_7A171 [Puccinia triticina]OAV96391.1 hypothetical protein PTTG_04034 [Puccinia triticina 1-1 BBBD Race 1]WAQ86445.1 hypothetical protein PtA15_7A171 [Puccinia triticina]WAR56325.1 hypothetical protein PtB15_7B171 [Puccinia triticina]
MVNSILPSTLDEYLDSLDQFKSNDRIESLYSDYSSTRQSNPAGFHSNNATWQIILTDLLRLGLQSKQKTGEQGEDEQETDRLVLHLNDQLLEALRRPSIGKPYGLACPLWALSSLSTPSSSALIAPLDSFLSTAGWGPATGIATTMVRSISWASRALTRGTILDPDQRFDQLELDQKLNIVKIDWVNLLLLRQAADRVIERYQQHFVGLSPSIDCLYTPSQFKDQLTRDLFPSSKSNLKLSATDMTILLKHLERDRRILVSEKNVIKFVLPASIETDREGTKYSRIGPTPINEVDRGVLSVKQTIHQLNRQIQNISAQIEQRTLEAKKYVQKSQPEIAATQLKSKKALQTVLSQRIGILETLNGVYLKIEQASTDAEIMNAYETSTKTLKSLLAEPALKLDRVSQTMDNLQEVLADQKEIDEAINQGYDSSAIDDQEIAAELAGLLDTQAPRQQQKQQQQQQSQPSIVPQPPTTVDELQAKLSALSVPETPDHTPSQQPHQTSESDDHEGQKLTENAQLAS